MDQLKEHFGWIEILFTALVAFGFGGWQYWSVSREIEHDKKEKRKDESARRSGHPVGEHELDDR